MRYIPAAEPALTGPLHLIPFKGSRREPTINERLSELSEAVDGPQIDVVTRFPTGVEQVEAALERDPTADTQSLSIETLSEHALSTVNECTDGMRWLSPEAENVLLVDHAQDYQWETEYLHSASEQDSFHRDLRSFVSDALRYPDLGDAADPVVADLVEFTESFYELLVGRNYVPPEAVVRVAVEQFREDGVGSVSQPDGLLAVQFGEFTAVERLYLAYLTQDAVFQGVAREQASIFRTQFEEGSLRKQTWLDINEETNPRAPYTPEAIGEWLATDDPISTDISDDVRRLNAETYEEHVRTIGTAIQQLHANGKELSDIAVVFRDASAPIGDAVDILWNMGVPVSSTVAGGLEHDTAVRELHTVVECLARMERGAQLTDLPELTRQLEARLAETDPLGDPATVVEQTLSEITASDGVEDGVGQWITETQLKHRIAVEDDAVHQRLTFDHVDRVLKLARFIDRSSDTESSWDRFQRAIEFEADYGASEQVAAELESQEVGVTVDTVGSLTGANFDYVFVAEVVDEEYPTDPVLNRLIPITRTEDIDVYPRAVPRTMDTVRETFATPEPPTDDPVRAYNQALNRRILAEATRMATRKVYFVTYETSAQQMGKQVHPSRYLSMLENEAGGVKSVSEATEVEGPEQVALDTVDERYRDAVLDSKSLPDDETLADEFGAIRTILEASDESLREALTSRRDWSQGVIGDE